LPFIDLGQKLGVAHRSTEGIAQGLDPGRGKAGGSHIGAANAAGSSDHINQAPVRIRRLVRIHEFVDGRDIGQSRVSFAAGLCQDADQSFFTPAMEGLAGKKGRDAEGAALHFYSFKRQVLLAAPLVSRDKLEFQPQGYLKKPGDKMAAGTGPGGRALGRLRGLTNVFQGFIRGVRPHVKQPGGFLRGTEPGKLSPVKLDLLAPYELVQVEGAAGGSKGKSVGLG